MSDNTDGVARLLEQYVSKPPKVKFSRDEIEQLKEFNRSPVFRKLKDAVRLQAWESAVPDLNNDPANPIFTIRFAQNQAHRRGILRAVELLEELVEQESDE